MVDVSQTVLAAKPYVLLDGPTLPENVGATARAMANCGLAALRIARPRGGAAMVLSKPARAMASGADAILEAAEVAPDLPTIQADLHAVIAVTARRRDLTKPLLALDDAAAQARRWQAEGKRVGLLFGRESSGLDNDAVAGADAIAWIPASPAFTSFNLAQAVLLVCHAWFRAGASPPPTPQARANPWADRDTVEGFFEQLAASLEVAGFLRTPGQRQVMLRNLRSLFVRAKMTEQEVGAMRGMVAALARLDPNELSRRYGGLAS